MFKCVDRIIKTVEIRYVKYSRYMISYNKIMKLPFCSIYSLNISLFIIFNLSVNTKILSNVQSIA